MLVIVGDTVAHIDDIDGLYYRDIAEHARARGDWFHLAWSQLPNTPFHEHLAPGIWLVGLTNAFGATGQRLFYGLLCFAMLALLTALAQKRLGDRAAELALWTAVCTEGFMRWQPQARLDPPFLLAWVLALWLAADFSPRSALSSGLAVGAAVVLRPPPSLALLALVPMLLLFDRRAKSERWLQPRDALALPLFLLAAALPLTAFAWADVHFGSGDALSGYWRQQVLASLSGTRGDGQSSHFAPLHTMLDKFWPGNAFLLLGAVVAWRRGAGPPRFVWFCLAWSVLVVLGFSLGRRHVGTHVWPAYLGLFVVCGWALSVVVSEEWLQRARSFLLVLAVVFIIVFASVQKRYCDVAELADDIASLAPCAEVLIGNNDWISAHRVRDHLRRQVRFVDIAAPAAAGDVACPTLLVAKHGERPPPAWSLWRSGRSRDFYLLGPPAEKQK